MLCQQSLIVGYLGCLNHKAKDFFFWSLNEVQYFKNRDEQQSRNTPNLNVWDNGFAEQILVFKNHEMIVDNICFRQGFLEDRLGATIFVINLGL